MKRFVTVVVGASTGVLVTAICLYTVALLWSRLAGQPSTPTATALAAVTEIARSTFTPIPTATAVPDRAPTEGSLLFRELGPNLTPTAPPSADLGSDNAGVLPLTRQDLQRPFETQGFDFQHTQLGDSLEHWVAASPDGLALVEIVGAEAVTQASVSVFGPIQPTAERAGPRAVYMLTMMQVILPEWPDGAEWFADELVKAARQSGDYESENSYQGVRVVFFVDRKVGAITLLFEPVQ